MASHSCASAVDVLNAAPLKNTLEEDTKHFHLNAEALNSRLTLAG